MASADGGPGFGHGGQLAVSWDQPLGGAVVAGSTLLAPMSMSAIDFQFGTASDNGGSATHFGLAPAADFFVIDNLSVGGQLLFGLTSTSPPNGQQGSTVTSYGIAPQVGYNLGLTDNISFWPKVYFGFTGSSTSNNGPSFTTGTLGIYAPFLFHPVSHFFLGIGPNFSTQVFANESLPNNAPSPTLSKVTLVGAMATFGGWFLGD